jgi:PGF-pre-PGF domain-containing protein
VNVGGSSAVTRVTVTGTGVSGLIVTGTEKSGAGANVIPPPGIVYQYIDLVPARYSTIRSTEIVFTVPLSWLEEKHLIAKDILLYHYRNGAWEPMPTTIGKTVNGRTYFSATGSGFSLFAISGQPKAVITVTNPPPETTPGNQSREPASVATNVPGISVTQTIGANAVTDPGLPPAAYVLIIAGIAGLLGGIYQIRRWWIQRQNPGLFRKD